MEIIKIDGYLDGGSIEIITNKGSYCIDDRISSTTKGSIYCNYPEDDNSNIAPNQEELKKEILDSLERYPPQGFDWIDKIKKLLICELK